MQNYNIMYLMGNKHVTDEVYQQIIEDNYEHTIPTEDLHTPKVNEYYISLNEEKNLPFLNKKLAEHGLYEGDADGSEEEL